MILPTDIPTRAEIDRLLDYRAPWSVSIYLPTDPASKGDPERIELRRHLDHADRALRECQYECDVRKCQRAKQRS